MLLDVNDLVVEFDIGKTRLTAVNHVSFCLGEKESLGLVGESGCGKSTTALALMNLLAKNGHITNGKVLINGKDMASSSYDVIRATRWKDIAMVFQNAMTALNPVQKIGVQIINALVEHENIDKTDAFHRAEYIFEKVGIAPSRLMQYPHEFSGGMKQRAVLALALVCRPKILLADEPTTALDVVAKRQVLELLMSLQDDFKLTLILISHDISAVAEACKKVAVMYGGQIVEYGETKEVLIKSNHPYTNALVGSFPSLHKPLAKLSSIAGSPPNLSEFPEGCTFAPRCKFTQTICRKEKPVLSLLDNGKLCRCHYSTQLDFTK